MKMTFSKTMRVILITVIVGFGALVATPPQVEGSAPAGPTCMGPICKNNTTGYEMYICTGCPQGWTQVFHRSSRREKQQLLHAYAAQSKPSSPAATAQPPTGSTLRSTSAIGLSVFILVAGLLMLIKLIRFFLARLRRPLYQPNRYPETPLVKKWTVVATSLIGVALVIGSSVSPGASSTKLSGHPRAVPAVAAAALSPLAGNFTSAIKIGGTGTTQIGGTAIDASGNLYVTGGFTGNIVFNTSPQTTLTSTQDDDLFVAKYDAGGHPLWARVANGATGLPASLSLDGGLAIALDNQGNSYVGGGFVKTLAFKDAGNNTLATLNSAGSMLNFEAFVAKYSANGTLLWAVGGMSGAPQDSGDLNAGINSIIAIAVDGTGNPYVTGSLTGNKFLGTPVTGTEVSELVVSRLNPATGAPVWISVAGGSRNDEALGMGIDAAANLYVIGDMGFTTTFPTQPPTTLTDTHGFVNSFVAKYNKNGQCLWVKAIGGEEFISGTHVAVNATGQIYVTGEFDGSVTFGSTILDEHEGGAHEDGLGGFIAKLDSDGQTWLWAREFDALGESVTLDAAGNPYLTGTFFEQAMFGSENVPTSQVLSSMAEEDQFVAKYDAAGNFKFAKALPGTGEGSENIIDSELVQVTVVPVQLAYNRATGSMNVSGDFSGSLTLDNLMLNSGADRHGFIAALDPPYDVCIQDDNKRDTMRINTTTGEYQFKKCSTGPSLAGVGTVTRRGSSITLQVTTNDRRVTVTIDGASGKATAAVQLTSTGTFSITDRNIANNTCACS
jgi:hypothetical protein